MGWFGLETEVGERQPRINNTGGKERDQGTHMHTRTHTTRFPTRHAHPFATSNKHTPTAALFSSQLTLRTIL